jgi:hypothetical protein
LLEISALVDPRMKVEIEAEAIITQKKWENLNGLN